MNQAVMEELRTNGGKMRGELEGWPFLIITTTGARSGTRRSVPLAHPDVTVELNDETFEAKAVVTEGADRDELFRRVCEKVDVFAGYQERTERSPSAGVA